MLRIRFFLFVLWLSGTALGQPPGYSYISQFDKPCHLRPSDLPWKVYETNSSYRQVTDYVLSTYNKEASRLGLPAFFVRTQAPQQAQLTVDWSGRGLPRDKAGGVFWDANLGYKRVTSLAMDGQHRVPIGNRAQILMQEFGHVLGLGDSNISRDIMHPVMHTRRYYRLSQVNLTPRDREALQWLYRQPNWVPILGRGQQLRKPQPPKPRPLFTPIP